LYNVIPDIAQEKRSDAVWTVTSGGSELGVAA